VARILLYGYCKEGVYPIALSAAFVVCTALGEDRVSSKVLVKSFMAYIAEDEREVLDNCLKNRSQIDKNGATSAIAYLRRKTSKTYYAN
jgi:hypothetical protein